MWTGIKIISLLKMQAFDKLTETASILVPSYCFTAPLQRMLRSWMNLLTKWEELGYEFRALDELK